MADEFLFPGPVWFLAPKPPFYSLEELRRTVLTGTQEDEVAGVVVPAVFVFSDRDLAERFLGAEGERAAPYLPLFLSDEQTIALLGELQSHGHRHLSTDPGPTGTFLLSVGAVIDQLRRRQAGTNPSAGPPG